MTPDEHQKTRRFLRDLGVVQSQDALNIQIGQLVELADAAGLYDASDLLRRQFASSPERTRVDT